MQYIVYTVYYNIHNILYIVYILLKCFSDYFNAAIMMTDDSLQA